MLTFRWLLKRFLFFFMTGESLIDSKKAFRFYFLLRRNYVVLNRLICWVAFYGILTIVRYLMSNHIHASILNIYNLLHIFDNIYKQS